MNDFQEFNLTELQNSINKNFDDNNIQDLETTKDNSGNIYIYTRGLLNTEIDLRKICLLLDSINTRIFKIRLIIRDFKVAIKLTIV